MKRFRTRQTLARTLPFPRLFGFPAINGGRKYEPKNKNDSHSDGRFGDPDEIAKAVAFLASDGAKYISGMELSVDCGITQI